MHVLFRRHRGVSCMACSICIRSATPCRNGPRPLIDQRDMVGEFYGMLQYGSTLSSAETGRRTLMIAEQLARTHDTPTPCISFGFPYP